MTKQAVALITALLVVAGLLAAGCGDDGNEASADSAPLTKAVFIKKADAICGANLKKVARGGTKLFNDPKSKKGEYKTRVVEDVMIPADERNIEAIEDLGAPEGDEEEIEEILDRLRVHVERVKEQGPDKFFEVEPAEQAEYSKIMASFKAYGFKTCYQPSI